MLLIDPQVLKRTNWCTVCVDVTAFECLCTGSMLLLGHTAAVTAHITSTSVLWALLPTAAEHAGGDAP